MDNTVGIPQPQNASPKPSFEAVAGLVAPANTPPWLEEYLEKWGPSVMLDRGVTTNQPTKKAMKERLTNVSNAAALLNKELSDTATREFLERAGRVRIENLGGLQRALTDYRPACGNRRRRAGAFDECRQDQERARKGHATWRLCPEDILRSCDSGGLEIPAWGLSNAEK